MPRLMSVSMTTDAVIARTKTVTRRGGWAYLKPGDQLRLCEKVQGRRKGEPLVKLALVEVVDVLRQPLDYLVNQPAYGAEEMVREGFPGVDPAEFIRQYFVEAQGMRRTAWVTRIAWKYLDGVSVEAHEEIEDLVTQERTADADTWYREDTQ